MFWALTNIKRGNRRTDRQTKHTHTHTHKHTHTHTHALTSKFGQPECTTNFTIKPTPLDNYHHKLNTNELTHVCTRPSTMNILFQLRTFEIQVSFFFTSLHRSSSLPSKLLELTDLLFELTPQVRNEPRIGVVLDIFHRLCFET